MQRLLVLQPYLPNYRLEFFHLLHESLLTQGVSMQVLIPESPDTLGRNDEVSAGPHWLMKSRTWTLAMPFARPVSGFSGPLRPGPGDAVIVGLQATLPDAWKVALSRRRDFGLGLWGHVGAYVNPANRLDVAAERWLMCRADHVFAYTADGARIARRSVPESRVTQVDNTIAVDPAYTIRASSPLADRLRSEYGLHHGRVFGFIGGLDGPKRIDFLANALDFIHTLDPTARLLVAGDGPDAHLLAKASSRGQVIMLGYGDTETKVAIAELASSILMPGRVGLVAVEALAMGRPIITTSNAHHGPEADYLQEGVSVFTTVNDAEIYATAAVKSLGQPRQVWEFPRLSQMVENFAEGCSALLLAAKGRTRHGGGPAKSDNSKSLWITNFNAPYRRPVWRHIGRHTKLTVGLVAGSGSADGKVRGADWFEEDSVANYEVQAIPGRSLRIPGGREIIMPTRGSGALVPFAGRVVVGGWEHPLYWHLVSLARRRGNRIVGFYESTSRSHRFSGGPIGFIRRRHFARMDSVLVPGRAAADTLKEMGVPEWRIFVGFNPVDVEKFRSATLAMRSPKVGGHRFVYVGQLIARKNVDSIVQAFIRVKNNEDRLTIVGDGVLRPNVQRTIHRFSDCISLQTAVSYDEMPALMATQHTLVLASREEVWGLVVNEALAAGLHVVVSNQAGVARSVEHMSGVFVCDPSEDSIYQAMLQSRESWSGHIINPEVLRYTPAEFAHVSMRAMNLRL